MSNYTKSTNFATKDNLSPGNPLKIVKGTEIDTEFNNIATAVATKTDGAASSTDNAIARFDSTTGKIIQNSVVTIDDTTGDIVGTATQGVFNTVSTTVNAFGAATTLNLGAATGTATVNNTTLAAKAITASTTLAVTGASTLTGAVTASSTLAVTGVATLGNGAVLGTPTSATLTNATGLPISTGVSGLGSNVATFLATPSSANLISAVTDETGTGALVFATSPTLVTPLLGTPTSATLTNATGLPISTGVSGLGTGVATLLATPSSANLASAITDETGSGALVFATSPTLVTPALGTPSSGTLTNATGLPIGTGVSGLGTGVATFLATPSSANLISAVTDETGTGALVFATSPTLVTPALGTPSSGTLTNATGLPISTGVSGLGTGVATFLATPSSANLLSALTDETGTGSAVFATSPTLVTPLLGTPTSGVATNLTGLPLTTGVTGLLPVANGGTATATPSIVAGTNITVTGTWPNQTIAASGSSGTVTSVAATVPSLFSISGSPITTSGTLAMTYSGTALPVVNGGTGQTTYTDGQLLIGNTTGNTLTKATLTAGSGISITNGGGSISIASTASGSQWTTSSSDIYYDTGNVGIGTSTAPTARLSATGTTTGFSTALINIRAMQNDGTTLGTPIVLAGHRYLGSQDNNSGVIDVPSSTGRMALSVNGTVMAAYNTTQMGIGANSFGDLSHRLAVIALSDLGIEVNCGSATATPMTFRSGGGNRGTITTTSGGTAYNTTSDYRLKENIQTMQNALATVSALKPVTYKWKADNSNGQGFIAHELAEVCPQAVTGQKDAVDANGNPEYQGIDTSFLIATLTAAIQEQQALITTLTERITALEGV